MSFDEVKKILKQERTSQYGPGLNHRCSVKGFE